LATLYFICDQLAHGSAKSQFPYARYMEFVPGSFYSAL
jgi:hypothetical protein